MEQSVAFEIRSARNDDLPAVLNLYRHLHARDGEPDNRFAAEVFARILAAPGMELFLARQDGLACASCYLNVIDNLTRGCAPYAIIENVVTDPAHRRRGLAKQVVQHAMSAAWNAGCYKVMLMTGQPHLVGFYESCGFDPSEKHGMIARRPVD
ncbi:MAG: GNAT family N-acetyltransferase [Alphaproteobacteria bacterium]|jgi:GNAT superfamily N-acetyltransferase|nr:GNAT family N-acetyltransferase [Rhodospirillaceae bacterium]MDG2483153.1 GNAT family N-acetyltransferase [Alphaproteobacteria bacterium]MBT6204261.1 GNAT family N-acetyltransferase [Rhodospirillaceae bacterium]MBT6509848.1 GNAT family N-acetyltransferase [Rhodospirillaceae bacterium]MBT7613548.1 GNAT family N-acetyltransferase [Rhodospirillaceae bacterium]